MSKKEKMNAYQGEIILRMLDNDEKKFQQFHEDYKAHCYTNGGYSVQVGEKEMKMLEMFDSGISFAEIARKTKQTQAVVRTKILYAALTKRK